MISSSEKHNCGLIYSNDIELWIATITLPPGRSILPDYVVVVDNKCLFGSQPCFTKNFLGSGKTSIRTHGFHCS